jgi:hypothetical protein
VVADLDEVAGRRCGGRLVEFELELRLTRAQPLALLLERGQAVLDGFVSIVEGATLECPR